MVKRLNSDDWDVMIYIASYISGYGDRPTRTDLEDAGFPACRVKSLLSRGLLTEKLNGLEPVLVEKSTATRAVA